MTDRELMQVVFDALDAANDFSKGKSVYAGIFDYEVKLLKERLAQPEPEPVAWHEPGAYGNVTVYEGWAKENGWLPLYTAPPQREFIGLTTKETLKLLEENIDKPFSLLVAVRDKLKEKNASNL